MDAKFFNRSMRLFILLVTASLGSMMADAGVVEFNACNVTTKKEGTKTVRAMGMWNISPSGYMTRYTSSNGMNSQMGGALGENVYYEFKTNSLTNPSVAQMQKWNYPAFTRNGAMMTRPNSPRDIPVEVAFNSNDGKIYGCFYNSDKTGWELGAIVPAQFSSNYSREQIATLPGKLMAMAFSPAGQLFAVDEHGVLLKISITDGNVTTIGATGHVPLLGGGAAFDNTTGELYWACVDSTGSAIYKVDTVTGASTVYVVMEYGEQLRGLHVYRPPMAEGVPSYAENVDIAFDKATDSGKASFRMPSVLYDGTPASGTATYTVKIGSQSFTGTATYGATVTDVAVKSDIGGVQMAEVVISNDKGDGPSHKLTVYVGPGTPRASAGVRAEYAGGHFNVTWDAVTGSADGCYIDPREITYTVTRLPDNVIVAENIDSLRVVDKVSIPLDPVTYSYSVVATYAGKTSVAAVSEGVRLGAIQPPYSNTFENATDVNEFTIINSGNDVACWTWLNGTMVMPASNTKDMDDWLITPPLSLKAGHAYELVAALEGEYVNVEESFEIKYGEAATAEAMTGDVLGVTKVIYGSEPTHTLVTVPRDGLYYIGIHAISPSRSGRLVLDNISIGEGLALDAPGRVRNFSATPSPDASTKITLKLMAPDLTIAGENAGEITRIELLRNDTLIETFEKPSRDIELQYDDVPVSEGDMEYSAIAYNEAGKGQSAVRYVYAGVNLPGVPRDMSVAETVTEGTVFVSWSAPGVDAAGFPIDNDLVTYDLYSVADNTRNLIAADLTETSYTHVASLPGNDQKFMQYGVIPKTKRGEGKAVASRLVAVGTSYKLPFVESFSYGAVSHIMGTEVMNGNPENTYWKQCTNGDVNKFMAADGDNGFINHYAKFVGQGARLFTGKIKIDASHPLLWFSLHCIKNDHNALLSVDVYHNGKWNEVKTLKVNEVADNQKGWARAVVDLTPYAGTTVQIGFRGETHGYTDLSLDDIRLFGAVDTDLSIDTIDAPVIAQASSEYSMSVKVVNDGVDKIEGHSVIVRLDGKPVGQSQGAALASGMCETHDISFNLPLDAGEKCAVEVEVKADGDLVAGNNVRKFDVNIAKGLLPGVAGLKAVYGIDNTVITWTAPDLKGHPVKIDSFEEMTSWSNEGSEWKFVDADDAPISGIVGLELPNIGQKSKQSWWVMDNSYEKIAEEYDFIPASGSKFLACSSLADNGQTDDWAITPRLTGESQAIGFAARSFHGRYPENFEILYSTTDNELSSFKTLEVVRNVPYNWTRYSFLLPQGTRYAAVRHITAKGFMLYMDDFTAATMSGEGELLNLIGYHITSDGIRLTDTPVTGTSYTHPSVLHDVSVYPVYSCGIGARASATALSAVSSIDMDAVSVEAASGEILIEGARGMDVSVTAVSGVLLYSGKGIDEMSIKVTPGVYLVKVNASVFKVIVR